MKITILNGNTQNGSATFEEYIKLIASRLESEQHSVKLMNLKEMDLKFCTGCFGCWVKTPGECITRDDGAVVRQAIIACDLLIWASPLKMGYVSNLLKRAMDKTIPLLMPYFDPINAEIHHAKRYDKYPLTGLIYETEGDTDGIDRQLLENIFARTSLNFRSCISFCQDSTTPVSEMNRIISQAAENKKLLPSRPDPTVGVSILPPTHLTVFNGSPRGRKGNTPILLDKFLTGFQNSSDKTYEMHDLIHINQMDQFTEAYRKASCVLLAFPLYTDSMPANVMAFIETLEQFKGRQDNPAMGFMVQSGFMEGAHSRHVEQYLQKLCSRLGCNYIGTIVKGGVEGIQIQPDNMTKGLFEQIRKIGNSFSERGCFDSELLRQLSKPEQFPRVSGPIMKLLSMTRLLDFYWDMQLKQNQVFNKRYSRPYLQ
jgi:multimeric flavodoxin WrbA